MKRTLRIALLLLSCLCLLASCDVFQKEHTVFVLVDLSGSTLRDRDFYHTTLTELIRNKRTYENLIVDKITENPMTQADFPIRWESEKWKELTINKFKLKKERKERQKTLVEKAEILLSENSPLTDILGSIYSAQRVFEIYNTERKTLIIMSDMIHECNTWHFKNLNLTSKTSQDIINWQKNDLGGMPKLPGVDVYIMGARAHNTSKMIQLRNFWIKYFQSCEAHLESKNFGRAIFCEFLN